MEKVSLKHRGVCHRHYSANTVAFTFVTLVDNVHNIFNAFQDGKRNNYSKKKTVREMVILTRKEEIQNAEELMRRQRPHCRQKWYSCSFFLMNLTEYVACFLLMDVKELKVQ